MNDHGTRPTPRGADWSSRTDTMKRLLDAQRWLVAAQQVETTAKTERDQAVQAAFAAGWTYEIIIANTGLSSSTISRILRTRR